MHIKCRGNIMKILNLFEKSVISVAVFATCFTVNAAENGRAAMSARMPTMPTFGLNTLGNPAVTTINVPAEVNTEHAHVVPDTPTPAPEPKPATECLDGGVKNSTYTVTMCMNDVLQCVNTGALQGGLNDLFNEDVRNAIVGGMKLCQASVDKCISDVRVNCRNVYNESADVWLDFNSRIIQPEYYNFVLRKTGLTPNQAENTCLLLDRNTYGSAFSAVSDMDAVNGEYKNKVGAYNAANGGSLSKDNPQGVEVNTIGYDGNRGHYARWDATNAECLIRVAAYNKDKLITNNWLFGAIGNDNPAEVWKQAGSTFSCNKDLFDFSLLNDTKTVAVVGVGGGTVLGGAIGAAAGAGAYNKQKKALDAAEQEAIANMYSDQCENAEYRTKLGGQIASQAKGQVLGTYLYTDVVVSDDGKTVSSGTPLFDQYTNFYNLTKDECHAIHDLYAKAELYKDAIARCKAVSKYNEIVSKIEPTAYSKETLKTSIGTLITSGEIVCSDQEAAIFAEECLFVPIQVGFSVDGPQNIFCNTNHNCLPVTLVEDELRRMNSLLDSIKPAVASDVIAGASDKAKNLSKGKSVAKGAAIGAATGAATGGLATAITAFVERNNISCKVGDGLNSVALGKSHKIDSLKDFYVKWNLNLPDTVTPTSAVLDRASWEQACTQFNSKLMDCPRVQINFKQDGKYELIQSACKVSGSICIMNDAVAASHGIE